MNAALVLFLVIALLIATALLAAAASALSVLSAGDVESEAESARFAGALRRISGNMSGSREATVFARFASEILAAVLLTAWLVSTLQQPWLGALIAAASLLFAYVLVTGAAPRSIGRNRPRDTIRILAPLVRLCRLLLGPITDLFGAFADLLVPSRASRTATVSSEEQLLSMVDAAAEQQVVEEGDRTLIHSVFEFSDTLVREVMVPRTDMLTLDAAAPVSEGLRGMLEAGFSRAPIIGRDSDDIHGVAYQKDLAKVVLDRPESALTVAGVARTAHFVPESLPAATLLRRMQHDSTHFAIVIDEYGGVAGLVTLEDLIEELIGDISDEYDRVGELYEWLDDTTLQASSRMGLGDLGEVLGRDLEHDEVDSLGGLLTTALGRIPQLGDRAEVDGLELLADRVGRRHRVTRIRVRVPARPHVTDQEGTA